MVLIAHLSANLVIRLQNRTKLGTLIDRSRPYTSCSLNMKTALSVNGKIHFYQEFEHLIALEIHLLRTVLS